VDSAFLTSAVSFSIGLVALLNIVILAREIGNLRQKVANSDERQASMRAQLDTTRAAITATRRVIEILADRYRDLHNDVGDMADELAKLAGMMQPQNEAYQLPENIVVDEEAFMRKERGVIKSQLDDADDDDFSDEATREVFAQEH